MAFCGQYQPEHFAHWERCHFPNSVITLRPHVVGTILNAFVWPRHQHSLDSVQLTGHEFPCETVCGVEPSFELCDTDGEFLSPHCSLHRILWPVHASELTCCVGRVTCLRENAVLCQPDLFVTFWPVYVNAALFLIEWMSTRRGGLLFVALRHILIRNLV